MRIVAKTLTSSRLRSGDNVSRYGGEEFLIILHGTDLVQALGVAEVVRSNINALELPHHASPTGYLTISIGVATLHGRQICIEGKPLHMIASGLIHRADTALYAAKKQGRNQVVSARDAHTVPEFAASSMAANTHSACADVLARWVSPVYANACRQSAIRSFSSSIPTDRRISCGVMPLASRCSSGIDACVMLKGWLTEGSPRRQDFPPA